MAMKLSDAIIQYKTCTKAEGQSDKTVKENVASVRRFSAFFGGDPILAEIDADDLRGFILALQKREAYAQHPTVKPQHRPLSPDTIATYVRSIKSFFAFLAREGIIPENRIATVKVPKTPERLMPILTEEEINKLLHQVRTASYQEAATFYRDEAIILTLLDTGLRISELCGLRDCDIDLEEDILRIRQ